MDSRGVNSTTIADNEAIAYVFVTGRSGTSGKLHLPFHQGRGECPESEQHDRIDGGERLGDTGHESDSAAHHDQNVSFTITGGSGAKGDGSNGIFGFFKV